MPKADFMHLFDTEYAPQLGIRAKTFRDVFVALKENATIVETGTVRNKTNFFADGGSTIQFDKYVQCCGGHVWSIDIEPREDLKLPLSNRTNLITSDSITFFTQTVLSPPIDLLYLDSRDGYLPGTADHMLGEFLAAKRLLNPGSIVFIDDIRTKGALIITHISTVLKWPPLTVSSIQMAWRAS